MTNHTVEKIGGTSMLRHEELLENVLIGSRKGDDLYNRIFVVSAYGGITDKLLEHKKTGEPGVHALFASTDSEWAWGDALTAVGEACRRSTPRSSTTPATAGPRTISCASGSRGSAAA